MQDHQIRTKIHPKQEEAEKFLANGIIPEGTDEQKKDLNNYPYESFVEFLDEIRRASGASAGGSTAPKTDMSTAADSRETETAVDRPEAEINANTEQGLSENINDQVTNINETINDQITNTNISDSVQDLPESFTDQAQNTEVAEPFSAAQSFPQNAPESTKTDFNMDTDGNISFPENPVDFDSDAHDGQFQPEEFQLEEGNTLQNLAAAEAGLMQDTYEARTDAAIQESSDYSGYSTDNMSGTDGGFNDNTSIPQDALTSDALNEAISRAESMDINNIIGQYRDSSDSTEKPADTFTDTGSERDSFSEENSSFQDFTDNVPGTGNEDTDIVSRETGVFGDFPEYQIGSMLLSAEPSETGTPDYLAYDTASGELLSDADFAESMDMIDTAADNVIQDSCPSVQDIESIPTVDVNNDWVQDFDNNGFVQDFNDNMDYNDSFINSDFGQEDIYSDENNYENQISDNSSDMTDTEE